MEVDSIRFQDCGFVSFWELIFGIRVQKAGFPHSPITHNNKLYRSHGTLTDSVLDCVEVNCESCRSCVKNSFDNETSI